MAAIVNAACAAPVARVSAPIRSSRALASARVFSSGRALRTAAIQVGLSLPKWWISLGDETFQTYTSEITRHSASTFAKIVLHCA
jgi:hypothetical protein